MRAVRTVGGDGRTVGVVGVLRATLIEPTHPYVRRRQLPNVLWSHAAYANKHIVIRNDVEIARFSLESGS